MKIIPVIDLQAGQVVHAVRGQRQHYQPIASVSRLTVSNQPWQVIADLLAFHAFDCCYIADLDAICGTGSQAPLIAELAERFDTIEFWVDAGESLSAVAASRRYKTVIGTESQRSPPHSVAQDYLLSLDFQQQALGNSLWFQQSQFWPSRIIVMTLARVGSNDGPDWHRLAEFRRLHPEKSLIAAGGVRDLADLQCLADMGVAGVLLASALHCGRLSSRQLSKFQAKKYPGEPGYSLQAI